MEIKVMGFVFKANSGKLQKIISILGLANLVFKVNVAISQPVNPQYRY